MNKAHVPARDLRCPDDGRVLLLHQSAGRSFFTCRSCHGLWIPRASIEAQHPSAEHLPLATRKARGDGAPSTPRACPVCEIGLAARTVQGLTIDECSRCRGVWLDAGEYDAVFAHVAAREAAKKREGGTTGNIASGLDAVYLVANIVEGILNLAT